MSVSVGIPRGLLYYKYFPLWQTFFESLGVSVVVSSPTNRRILVQGLKKADGEICLPVKIFYGHVLDLSRKVDFLFIPRVIAVEKYAYTCPKLLGLPDMIRASDDNLPPVLAPVFNRRLGWREYYLPFYQLGQNFSSSRLRVSQALWRAIQAQAGFERRIRSGWSFEEALQSRSVQKHFSTPSRLRIGVAGHSYNVIDSFVSLNLLKKLRDKGAAVLTTDMVSPSEIEETTAHLPKRLFWTYEKEVVGSALSWLQQKTVDGVIYVLSFACGPDSMIQVVLEQEAKRLGRVPLMPIVIDEHTAETGMLTRLEAFLDMIAWQKGLLV